MSIDGDGLSVKARHVNDANGNLAEKGTKFVDTEETIEFFDNEGEYVKYEYDLANRLVKVLRSDTGKASAAERALPLRPRRPEDSEDGERRYAVLRLRLGRE